MRMPTEDTSANRQAGCPRPALLLRAILPIVLWLAGMRREDLPQ